MDLYNEAIARFSKLLQLARESELREPTAFTLATSSADGRPSARTVLLKDVSAAGFVFYTNRLSRKGRQLENNPRAALCFFWQPLLEQVLVEGCVENVSDAEADAYFASRPRLSQLGAWASHQSDVMSSRGELEERLVEYENRFADTEVPRPPHWSGYRVVPDMIEFWSSRPGRLHDRVRYTRTESGWQFSLINP